MNDLRVLKICPNGKKQIKNMSWDSLAWNYEIECHSLSMPVIFNNKYAVICDRHGEQEGKEFNISLDGIKFYGTVLVCRVKGDWCGSIEDEDIPEIIPGAKIRRNLI